MELKIRTISVFWTIFLKLTLLVIASIVAIFVLIKIDSKVWAYILAAVFQGVAVWILLAKSIVEIGCTYVVRISEDGIRVNGEDILWKQLEWYRLTQSGKGSLRYWALSDGLTRIKLVRNYYIDSDQWDLLEEVLVKKLNQLNASAKSAFDHVVHKVLAVTLLVSYPVLPFLMWVSSGRSIEYAFYLAYLFATLSYVIMVPIDISNKNKMSAVPKLIRKG